MIKISNSYSRFKKQTQDAIDFIYLCCHAMPALNGYIKAVKQGEAEKLPDADYFKSQANHERLQEIKSNYKKVLGDFLILSSFSYFESYVFDLFDEIFCFHCHDSNEGFLDLAQKRRKQSFNLEKSSPEFKKIIKQLRERPKEAKRDKYTKAKKLVSDYPYQFPTELFALFGIKQLQSNLKGFKAKDIPMLVEDILGVQLTEEENVALEKIRNLRNDIAHGDNPRIDLKRAIQHNESLRKIALKIDQQALRYFFVLE